MIHTASLVHDDVLDDCDTRRGENGEERDGEEMDSAFSFFLSQPSHSISFLGQTTVNSLYGTRVAVLAGDFLFAQSSWFLANLDNLEVIKLISQVSANGGKKGERLGARDWERCFLSNLRPSFPRARPLGSHPSLFTH